MSRTVTRLGAIALAGLCLAAPAAAATDPAPATATAQNCSLVELMIVVAVRDGSGRLVRTTTSDRNGRFTLKGLTPGTYTFTFSGDSLTRAFGKGGPGQGDRPGIIGVLIGLLLPAGRVEPVSSDEFPLVSRASGGNISIESFSFTRRLPAPAGSGALKPGQTFDYQGTLSLRAR